MQATVGNRSAAEGALLEQPRSRQTPPGTSADSLLSHVEITGDFDFKDHNDRNHFLACEINMSTGVCLVFYCLIMFLLCALYVFSGIVDYVFKFFPLDFANKALFPSVKSTAES